jgi:hypothetical protein
MVFHFGQRREVTGSRTSNAIGRPRETFLRQLFCPKLLYALTETCRRNAVAHAAQFCRVGTLGLIHIVFTLAANFSRIQKM